ncbi:reverse transcriptase/maturase family protein [Leucothrix pacifica]|uniref:RNA-dependent DNA polymerase n=1 Tax=Leucothrix pacifica TaxID=1247513 RepID=A0A317CBP9_9GAMM|nr:reverse transcriptase/maturase family protein [Leucothrix pacifica]PWQ96054.1 RNA-dependent DNA polymerase [Leucothrix pacifica]
MSEAIPLSSLSLYEITQWDNLLQAWKKAAKGKRSKHAAASFEHQLADELLLLQAQLRAGSYQPGAYTHFYIHEPKCRKISAAPFRDRVVHHALCNMIEPCFEKIFIADSYANRVGKGTHKAINRFQHFSKQYRYVLRMDIVKHFPSLDHQILNDFLCKQIVDEKVTELIRVVLESGKHVHQQDHEPHYFPGDDLLSAMRPKGLPIGNLTSQFWSNCYLHPLDLFVKRGLSCRGYLRYVDDFALFSDSKAQLWQWKREVIDFLAQLRLRIHEHAAQVTPCSTGIPWLGFVIYPSHKRLKSRKVVHASRHLGKKYDEWQQGKISFAEFDACVQGWINHVRYADSWGLRKHILRPFKH